MAGQSGLRLFPYGKETTKGTLAAATGKLLINEPDTIKADHVTDQIKDMDGGRANTTRSMVYTRYVEDTLKISRGYFQALPIIFSIGLKGGVTPVEQTASEGDYLWDFSVSLTEDNDPDAIAIWLQDNITQVERHYVMAKMITETFTIPQGQGNANYEVSMDYFARQNVIGSPQTGLSDPSVETINSKLMRLYIDSLWADLGTTPKDGILRKATIQTITGIHATFNGGQNLYFDKHEEGLIGVTAAFTFERNATSQAIIAKALSSGGAKTPEALRFEVEGGQIGAGVNHKLTGDFFGYWDQYVGWAEEADGTLLDTVTFVGQKDPVSGNMLKRSVITDINSI